MLSELEKNQARVVGTKQTLKELGQDKVKRVFLAQDADKAIQDAIVTLAQKKETEIIYVDTMEEIGGACNIDVGAACAAILND